MIPEANPPHEAIAFAQAVGTLGKINRDAQYSSADQARPEKLLNAVNKQGNHIRGLQADKERMQKQLMNLKLRNTIVASAVTGFLLKLPEIIGFVYKLTR